MPYDPTIIAVIAAILATTRTLFLFKLVNIVSLDQKAYYIKILIDSYNGLILD
jgi:uncharacterized protein YxeA